MKLTIAIVANLFASLTLGAASYLEYKGVAPGQVIKEGVELRILPIGDSITVGWSSFDKNGCRLKLRENLFGNKVVFAGTTSSGNMSDPYYAGWVGMTIEYMTNNIYTSLKQRPNIVLIHAGTNDMNPRPGISQQGHDPTGAAIRLGNLIDKIVTVCPDATVLVAQIINTCDPDQRPQTISFQKLIPGVVEKRRKVGRRVLAVNFASLGDGILYRDCIHPSSKGYHLMANYWYDFITQIPKDWITKPVGPDPDRSNGDRSD
ncbi:GDSL-like Lipase/Acylhydrolase [Colletotrichum truncatum]|uniref:GDSL-like Lipase/Acylhydrolase n=1 Tax=Colletotrichum truncatum TaxID=5467 RepID=A0ACC3YCF4_COLTU|nr:GDSL-like Lipase/Acylhydrolase [Colletotrichum truncatum]KAF6794061.1 GDSL-like Lipase/Acylhydrolase [Colletotrichum truncatum]